MPAVAAPRGRLQSCAVLVALAVLAVARAQVIKAGFQYVYQVAGGPAAIGDGGAATEALLTSPMGLALDDVTGHVYISGACRRRVCACSYGGVLQTAACRLQGGVWAAGVGAPSSGLPPTAASPGCMWETA
jgi:hypothetical protein